MIRLACLLAMMISPMAAASDAWTVWLVRHAEKATGADPQLTEEGQARAANLSDLLASAGIERVWTSDYRRTRQTAGPLANRLGLALSVYDPRQLDALSRQLEENAETALVVGHSNTTPQLVRALGGQADDMEEWQYDRVYQLRISADGRVETTLLHLPPLSPRPVTTDTESDHHAPHNSARTKGDTQ